MVRLPFAGNPKVLGKTLALAQRRFSSLERRLERDPAMLEGYVSFLDESERLNLMTEVQRRLLIWSRHAGRGDKATRLNLRNSRVGKTKVEEVVRKPPRVA